jgi:hypothetical protein
MLQIQFWALAPDGFSFSKQTFPQPCRQADECAGLQRLELSSLPTSYKWHVFPAKRPGFHAKIDSFLHFERPRSQPLRRNRRTVGSHSRESLCLNIHNLPKNASLLLHDFANHLTLHQNVRL